MSEIQLSSWLLHGTDKDLIISSPSMYRHSTCTVALGGQSCLEAGLVVAYLYLIVGVVDLGV